LFIDVLILVCCKSNNNQWFSSFSTSRIPSRYITSFRFGENIKNAFGNIGNFYI
jgi:hypothetical protein